MHVDDNFLFGATTHPNPKDNNIHKHNGIHVDQVKNKIDSLGTPGKGVPAS